MLMNNNDYIKIVENIKGEIREAQYKATLHVNQELIMLYYHIGQVINEHKTWGSKFIENLAADIHMSFPNVTGYSARNLKYMAKLAATYLMKNLCNRLLHKFHGVILRFFWINFRTIQCGTGILAKRLKMAGQGMS